MRFDLPGDGFGGIWVYGRAIDEDFAREVFGVVGLLEERFEGAVVVDLLLSVLRLQYFSVVERLVYHCKHDITLLDQLAETLRWNCAKTLQVIARSHCTVVENELLVILGQILLKVLCHGFAHGSKAILFFHRNQPSTVPYVLGNASGADSPSRLASSWLPLFWRLRSRNDGKCLLALC